MSLIVRFLSIAALAVLAGCHLSREDACTDLQHYGQASSVPALKPAEGLPAANTKNALKIPDAGEPKPRAPGAVCLDQPPSFYPDRPKPKPTKS